MITLFSSSFIEKEINKETIPNFDEKMKLVNNWRSSIIESKKQKETSIKSAFITTVFEKLLGYKQFGSEGTEYHFKEEWNVKNIGRADFVLGDIHKDKVEIIGELKSLNDNLDAPQKSRKDLRTAVQQGLEYLSNMPEYSKFLLVSNQNEIRIYKRGIHNRYDSFYFKLPEEEEGKGKKDLTDETELKKFIFLLCKENLLTNGQEKSNTEKILDIQSEEEKHLEKKFYSEYKQLREKIFFGLLQKNPEYKTNKAKLLSLTQKFLDRIIFCWFCEDSREQLLPSDVLGILINKEIKDTFYDKNNTSIYNKVRNLFNAINEGNPVFKIDEGYNGGLFEEDKELDNLNITNDIFEIIGELSKYDFGNDEILNVNVLGHIFEQSISDLEELKSEFEGEEYDKKKSKRKKEGVYYTPEYITKYIVENTIGKWLEERMEEAKENNRKRRTRKEESIYIDYQRALQNIKVLDPACGSGAFLVQAFDYLFNENKRVVDILNSFRDSPSLFDTYEYVKQILQNNLYGVDLNSESVEITKLSLWLKTAERNKKLTALDNNIKCGNSLIDDPEIAGEKAFKWEDEFPDIMKNGGFDCVIGNPPYVNVELVSRLDKDYYVNKYKTFFKRFDLFGIFFELAINTLNKNDGRISFIIPSQILNNSSYTKLRELILDNKYLEKVLYLGDRIFEDANNDVCIITLNKRKTKTITLINAIDFKNPVINYVDSSYFGKFGNVISFDSKNSNTIFDKIFNPKFEKLSKNFEVFQGIVTGNNPVFIFNSENEVKKSNVDKELLKTVLLGKDFGKWYIRNTNRKILYINEKVNINEYKNTLNYLEKFKNTINNSKSSTERSTEWYCLHRPRIKSQLDMIPKILIQRIRNPRLKTRIVATIDMNGFYGMESIIFVVPINERKSASFIITILNSKLINYLFSIQYLNVTTKIEHIKNIPIPNIPPESQQPFIEKADIMLTLNKELNEKKQSFFEWLENAFSVKKRSQKLEKMEELSKDEFTKELEKVKVNIKDMGIFNQCIKVYKDIKSIKDEIDKTDAEIDEMVFDLYELTQEERKIVNEI